MYCFFFQQLLDSKRRHVEDDVKLRGLQAKIKSYTLKKQENGEKDEGVDQKEKEEEFITKEEPEATVTETALTQSGPSSERDAKLIGMKFRLFV